MRNKIYEKFNLECLKRLVEIMNTVTIQMLDYLNTELYSVHILKGLVFQTARTGLHNKANDWLYSKPRTFINRTHFHFLKIQTILV